MSRGTRIGLAISVSALAFLAGGMPTAAAENLNVGVQSQQVLPPSTTSACPTMPLVDTVTYTYAGALHSFDIVVSNPSYVALAAQAGDTVIPFNYITRSPDAGGVRMHVDMPSTPILGTLPVSVTLLSVQSGLTCLSTVSFSLQGPASPTPTATPPSTPPAPPAPPSAPSSIEKPATTTVSQGDAATSGATTTVVSSVVGGAGLGSTLLRACATTGGALQLWFVLLTIFLLLAAIAAITEPPLMERNVYLPAALIGVPLGLLAAFWLLASDCRGAWWVPVLALGVAIVAMLWAYRGRPEVAKVIQLPAGGNGNGEVTTDTKKGSTK
jgi:hypothetical protein